MPLLSDEFYMQKALQLANQAFEEDEVPVGALVVTDDGTIIGKGYNQTEKLTDVTAHAEMLAITAAANYLGGKYLRECTLFVTLEPCVMCAGAIAWSQVDRIVYGAPDEKRGYRVHSEAIINSKKEVYGGVLADESRELILEFFKKKRT
ncbi:tRNA(adenine34) deaminase [Spirosomataceae bacterium TFI 002]|nr:tRNA(adenine34) deaminase [Spirosomataceae bacterium TFI 002]